MFTEYFRHVTIMWRLILAYSREIGVSFDLRPMQSQSLVQLIGIVGFCLAFALVSLTYSGPIPAVSMAVFATLIALASLFAWIAFGLARATVTVDDHRIVLSMPFYGREIELDRIEAGSLERTNLARAGAHTPTWRTNGLSVGGLNFGWFLTRGAGKALMAVTSDEAVTWKTKDGYSVVVSVTDADGLARVMKAALAR